jgi:hypothetical protein
VGEAVINCGGEGGNWLKYGRKSGVQANNKTGRGFKRGGRDSMGEGDSSKGGTLFLPNRREHVET